MQEKEIKILVLENNKSPFFDWFNRLDKTTRTIIARRILRMRIGNFGNCKYVGEEICELKINYGPGYRVYFVNRGKEIIVVLLAGNKSTQQEDIKNAKELYKKTKDKIDRLQTDFF